MPRKIAESRVRDAIAELDKVRKDWLKRPGVTGVDVGYKISGDRITDELAIRVHVRRKLPPEALSDHEIFTVSGKPSKIGGISVDVIPAEYGPARTATVAVEPLGPEAVDRLSRVDPLVGGISVGNPRITAGTLGAIVWDRTDCQPCILSNWHVLCGSTSCTVGESIVQPGDADGGTVADEVATLKRSRLDRDADAALAQLTGARANVRDILGLNPIAGIEAPALGMEVVKSGRTTAVTEGIIDGLGFSTSITYPNGPTQAFHDQIHIVPRPPWPAVDYESSSGGDSGSVWINQATGNAVGLHFAGETETSPSSEHAGANRMDKLAELLNFSVTPLFCPAPVVDERLRESVRDVLCRYYPWLCGSDPARSGCSRPVPIVPPVVPTHALPVQEYAVAPVGIERLLDDIMADLRRRR